MNIILARGLLALTLVALSLATQSAFGAQTVLYYFS